MWQAPITWVHDGTVNGTKSTFILPNHTVTEPEIVIYDRKPPVLINGAYTAPGFRVRLVKGFTDADGNPKAQRFIVDMSLRWPHDESLGTLNTAYTSFRNASPAGTNTATDWFANVYTTLFLPTEVSAV